MRAPSSRRTGTTCSPSRCSGPRASSSSSLPAIGLMALALCGARPHARGGRRDAAFARRYVTMLALGPFPVTTLVALAAGRLPVAMWGYPLWSFAPLAALAVVRAGERAARGCGASRPASSRVRRDAARLCGRRGASSRSCATGPRRRSFPAGAGREGHARPGARNSQPPLAFVGGGEFATNNIAVYSPDKPRVIVHADSRHQPVGRSRRAAQARRRDRVGGRADRRGRERCARLSRPQRAGAAPAAAPDVLGRLRPARVHFAIVPPRP